MAGALRPDDPAVASVAGHDADRILVLGSESAVGLGVASHDHALPGALARAVATRTGRGSHVTLAADTAMNPALALARAADHDLARFDAIILALGDTDIFDLTPARVWHDGMERLLVSLVDQAAADIEVVVVGIQPVSGASWVDTLFGRIAERHRVLLNRETQSLTRGMARVTYIDLPVCGAVRDGEHPTADDYSRWGEALAEHLVPLLALRYHPDGDRRSVRRASAHTRHVPPGMLPLAAAEHPDAYPLDLVVALACNMIPAGSALLSIVDFDRLREVERALGTDDTSLRADVVRLLTDRGSEPVVSPDLQASPAFREFLAGRAAPWARFYAGFPIEDASGTIVGSVCIVDSQPRIRADDIDTDAAAHLAEFARTELWRFLPDLPDAVIGLAHPLTGGAGIQLAHDHAPDTTDHTASDGRELAL